MAKSELEQYKEQVAAQLGRLSPLLQSYALGDFSESIEIPEEENEFTELLVGLSLMVDDIKEIIHEREDTIARLRQAEEALRAGEQKYRSMIMNLGEGLYSVTLDGTLLDHNIEFNRILGFDPEENLAGIQLPDFWQDPQDRKAYLEEFRKHGFIKNYLIAAKKRNGEKIFVEASSRLVRDEQDKPVRIEGTFIDVTGRVRAEEELLLKNIVFESSVASNSIAGNDGVITHVNPAFLQMWGYETKEAATGNSVASFFVNEEDAIPVIEALNETGRWTGEFLAKKRDGSTFISRGFATVVRNEQGEQVGYQSANYDVTAEKEAEEKLRQTLAELERTNANLETFNRLAVGREMRMIELKRQINELSEQLGKEPPYDVSFIEENVGGA